jgi:protein disulfide-isomerase A6
MKLKGIAKLVQVDCDNSINRDLCGKFDVKGFPTLKLFGAGVKGIPSDYNGGRTAKDIVDTIIPMIPSKYVIKVVDGKSEKKVLSLSDFKKKGDGKLAKALLVTDKKSTPALIKGFSLEYLDRLIFGVASKKEAGVLQELKIEKFPTVVLFTQDGDTIVYKGKYWS